MEDNHHKLQEKRRKKAEQAQAQLDILQEQIEKKDRLTKIESQIEKCLIYLAELIELTNRLSTVAEEGVTNEAQQWLEQFQREADMVIDAAKENVQRRKSVLPDAKQLEATQMSGEDVFSRPQMSGGNDFRENPQLSGGEGVELPSQLSGGEGVKLPSQLSGVGAQRRTTHLYGDGLLSGATHLEKTEQLRGATHLGSSNSVGGSKKSSRIGSSSSQRLERLRAQKKLQLAQLTLAAAEASVQARKEAERAEEEARREALIAEERARKEAYEADEKARKEALLLRTKALEAALELAEFEEKSTFCGSLAGDVVPEQESSERARDWVESISNSDLMKSMDNLSVFDEQPHTNVEAVGNGRLISLAESDRTTHLYNPRIQERIQDIPSYPQLQGLTFPRTETTHLMPVNVRYPGTMSGAREDNTTQSVAAVNAENRYQEMSGAGSEGHRATTHLTPAAPATSSPSKDASSCKAAKDFTQASKQIAKLSHESNYRGQKSHARIGSAEECEVNSNHRVFLRNDQTNTGGESVKRINQTFDSEKRITQTIGSGKGINQTFVARSINQTFEPSQGINQAFAKPIYTNVPNHHTFVPNMQPIPEHQTFEQPNWELPRQYQHQEPIIRNSYEKFLPTWKLEKFDGNPIEWPEWQGMFASTVLCAPISNQEKLTHLKTLVSGKAKAAIGSFGFDGTMFEKAWQTLQQKFGRPSAIVDANMRKVMDFPPIKMHNSEQLVDFSVAVSSLVAVLQNLDFEGDLRSSSNVRMIVSKLPPNLMEKWFSYIAKRSSQSVNLVELDDWLQTIASTHELLMEARGKGTKLPFKNEKAKTTNCVADAKSSSEKKTTHCAMCGENHPLWKCLEFKKKSVDERSNFAKEKKLCYSCLDAEHMAKDCTKKLKCREKGCKSSHNTLLHRAQSSSNVRSPDNADAANITHTIRGVLKPNLSRGILQVIKVIVTNDGKEIETFALCDTGSTLSWIAPSLEKDLNLSGQSTTINVQSFTGVEEVQTNLVNLGIKSKKCLEETQIEALVKPGFHIGTDKLDIAKLKRECPHLDPLDDETIDLNRVQLLLGQSAFKLIRPLEYLFVDEDKPWAVRLPLGWALSGPLPPHIRDATHLSEVMFTTQIEQDARLSTHFEEDLPHNEDKLANQIKHWWDMESYASSCNVRPRSIEDKKSMEILEKTTYHNGERYCVGMLWKGGTPNLPNNYTAAKSQLLTLEKRLARDEGLRERYAQTIAVDLEKKYVRKVSAKELEETRECVQWYLPCHPHINPHKPEKVRRVCNAASKYKGTSLNDALMTGPDLLNNLIGIILRFRSNPIVLLADVEAMFLQVATPEDDQRTTRFLWREGPSSEIEVYQYMVRIFGGTDSPTCANYALKRTGIDNKEQFPEAAETVQKDFYMDDLAKAVLTTQFAITLYLALKKLLKIGGFNLTKWFSNDKTVLKTIKEEGETLAIKDGDPHIMTILGLKWDVEPDILYVARGLEPHNAKATPRGILSIISSVYDPLGVLAPFMVKGRLLMRSIWQEMGQAWDKPVQPDIHHTFENWITELKSAKNVRLERQFFVEKPEFVELHAFADASETAMCAVLYFRGVFSDGTTHLAFAVGKSRVGPIRHLTIPKMELQAALIAVRLTDQVTKEIEFKITRTVYWSDSSTVLQWIQNSAKKQPVFVANRVQEILDSTSVDQWRYVPTAENPADHGTRGISPEDINASTWITGPAFLYKPDNCWPTAPFNPMSGESENQAFAGTTHLTESRQTIVWERFSNFKRLANSVAYCLRLAPHNVRSGSITASELKTSHMAIWKLCQMESFKTEIHDLKCARELSYKSSIKPLAPYIDQDGILRAGGRLRKCLVLPDSSKFPIILDAKHPAVRLYLVHIHDANHHQGIEYLRSIIQENFWIIKLRSTLRSIKMKCLVCRKRKATHYQPIMADLPSDRVNPCLYPFAQVGVDFFGPFQVKNARNTLKRYGFLFTCSSTRAIHIEVCQSLETDSCLLAIQRFIARRGKPAKMLSDNGTNFVGAVKELTEGLKSWKDNGITSNLAQQEIEWRFNPPGAPHFGGVWERMVQACKRAIYVILKERRLTEEVLTTVMCITEQTLNARPITPVSPDIEDLSALIPNHFLLGRPTHNLPLCWTARTDINLRKAYKRAESYSQLIWDRWFKEFLPPQTVRTKWQKQEQRAIKVGDLVWMHDHTLPRATYPLARVLEVYKGADGHVRSAKIKTKLGEYVRPAVKLIPLEDQTFGVPNPDGDRAGNVKD